MLPIIIVGFRSKTVDRRGKIEDLPSVTVRPAVKFMVLSLAYLQAIDTLKTCFATRASISFSGSRNRTLRKGLSLIFLRLEFECAAW